MSLRLKTIVGIAAIEAVLLVLLVLSAQRFLRDSNVEQFANRAETTVSLFASATKNAVISTDLALLETFVNEVMKNKDLQYAIVRGQGGQMLAAAGNYGDAGAIETDSGFDEIDDGLYDVSADISESGIDFGQVELGFKSQELEELFASSQRTLSLLATLEMLMVALFSYLLGSYLTRQLRHLTSGATAISDGTYGIEIPVKGSDELSHAAKAFNSMSKRLKKTELQRNSYLQSPIQTIVTLNSRGEVLEANAALEIMVGWSRDRILGEKIFDCLMSTGRSNPLQDFFEKGEAGEPSIFSRINETEFYPSAAGDAFYCEWHISNIEIEDEQLYVLFAQNINDRKKVELELIDARTKAESANEAKSEFLSNMTHELRTPLQGIIGFSSLGIKKTGKVPEEKISLYFSTIKGSADTLLSLVNNLLDLTKLQSGKMDFELNSADLGMCIESIISELAPAAELRGIGVEFDSSEPMVCPYDRIRIEQVLRNLLSNAIKFSEDNSSIYISCIEQDQQLQVSMTDRGVGVPAGEEEVIFERFAQSTATKTAAGGTGLGLPLCREIISRHGGRIWVESGADSVGDTAENSGATFYFTLPIAEVQVSENTLVTKGKEPSMEADIEPTLKKHTGTNKTEGDDDFKTSQAA